MPENTISNLYIMLLVASGMIIGISYFVGDFMNNYGQTAPEFSYLNKTGQITGNITDVYNKTIEVRGITGIDILDKFITGIYESIKLTFNIGDLYTAFIGDLASYIGIPGWAISIAIAGVFCVILFGIISLVLKWKA